MYMAWYEEDNTRMYIHINRGGAMYVKRFVPSVYWITENFKASVTAAFPKKQIIFKKKPAKVINHEEALKIIKEENPQIYSDSGGWKLGEYGFLWGTTVAVLKNRYKFEIKVTEKNEVILAGQIN